MLTPDGRITMGTFWTRFLLCCFAGFLGGFLIETLFPRVETYYGYSFSYTPNLIYSMISNLWLVLITAFNIIQAAKRMHDVNKSGWFQLIPVYSWILLLTPGTIGPNKYGLDPRNASNLQKDSDDKL